jgi:hypothetical protein
MRESIALAVLLLLSTAATAEDWVVVRKPSDPGQAGLPSILVDLTSIVILDNGIRRARVKIDFLADGRKHEQSAGNVLTAMILVKSYDCDKRMIHEESMESQDMDGSVHTIDLSHNPKWYPAPEIKAADPTIDFVCGWRLETQMGR